MAQVIELIELDGLTGTGTCQKGHRRNDDGVCECRCGSTDDDGWCVYKGCDDDNGGGNTGGGCGGDDDGRAEATAKRGRIRKRKTP